MVKKIRHSLLCTIGLALTGALCGGLYGLLIFLFTQSPDPYSQGTTLDYEFILITLSFGLRYGFACGFATGALLFVFGFAAELLYRLTGHLLPQWLLSPAGAVSGVLGTLVTSALLRTNFGIFEQEFSLSPFELLTSPLGGLIFLFIVFIPATLAALAGILVAPEFFLKAISPDLARTNRS